MDTRTWDPYAVLGVHRDASAMQVARAHRRLAKRYHPDLHPDAAAERAMQRINEAWQLLSVPSRRAEFDRRNPTAGLPGGAARAHWSGTRSGDWQSGRSRPTSWAAWQATSSDRAAAARVMPGATPAPSRFGGRRPRDTPADAVAAPRSFRDSGWAAIVLAIVLVSFVLLAAGVASYWVGQEPKELRIELRRDLPGGATRPPGG